MKKFFASFISLFLFFLISRAADISSGLNFNSHCVIKEERTSILLNNGNAFNLSNGFSLNFELRLRSELHNYGYIFRIIANDTICFDLVSNYSDGRKSLCFIEGNKIFAPFSNRILEQYRKNSWAKIQLNLNPMGKEISIAFNDEKIKIPYLFNNLSKFRFQFGYCNHPDFSSYDVPPMAIRNIRILNNAQENIAYWPLREHQITEVYDSVSSRPAQVFNPNWEIDKHTKWKKETSFLSGHYTQIAFNEKEELIYLADQKNVFVYHLSNQQIDTLTTQSGNPYYVSSNQLIFHNPTNELWSYDFASPHISKFNFKTKSWSRADKETKNPIRSHHNSIISTRDSNLYTFGGYGEYHYQNDLLKLYADESKWEKISIKELPSPRYLSALGVKSKDTLLIFGGYGNESGLQDLGPHHYYDLYAVNPYTGINRKLWSLKEQKESFVVSNSMVINTPQNKIYTLCFPNNQSNSHIALKSFDISNGYSESLADTIPFTFEDINAYCSLFLSKKEDKLYAITIFHKKKESQIAIYSLYYQPLSAESIIQHPALTFNYTYIYLGALTLCLIVGIILILMRQKRDKKQKTSTPNDSIVNNTNQYTTQSIPKQSAIFFLGGFQVWDKNGDDITKSVTPTLKHLLILIILYMQKNGKGISNSTLCEILWYDKSDESAQNNRRVSIRKLKVMLKEIGGIELVNANTYWSIQCDETFFCDYNVVFDSLKELRKQPKIEIEKLYRVLHLIANGLPLPYLNQEWTDTFKSDYANYVQDTLWGIVQSDNAIESKLLIQIADTIFLFDPTDENAIQLKCRALVNSGKVGLAKTTYDNFCAEYIHILGTTYHKTFKEICHANV